MRIFTDFRYYVKLLGNVDALVFAGGIGEKGGQLRQAVIDKVACLGFGIDKVSIIQRPVFVSHGSVSSNGIQRVYPRN